MEWDYEVERIPLTLLAICITLYRQFGLQCHCIEKRIIDYGKKNISNVGILFYRIILTYAFDYLKSPFNKMLPFRNLILKSRESHLPNFQTSKFNTSALEMHLHQQQHMYTNF